VAAMDNILRPLAAQHATLLQLVNQPCQDVHLTLRKLAASLQTVRSIALVQSTCSIARVFLANEIFRFTSYSRRSPPITPCSPSATTHRCLKGRRCLSSGIPLRLAAPTACCW
jgi:hypothetical protein